MHRAARWKAPSPPPRSAAASRSSEFPNTEAGWRGLLGRKVSVRYRIPDDPAHPFSEAIGVVADVGGGPDGSTTVSILTKRGETKSVPIADIEAAKTFPS